MVGYARHDYWWERAVHAIIINTEQETFFFNLELQLQPRVFISYYVHHCKNPTSGTLGPSFYTGCTMYKFEQEHIVLHKT